MKKQTCIFSISASQKDKERADRLISKVGYAGYSDLFRSLLRSRAKKEGLN